VLFDLLVAFLITVVAVVLGITVHPWLFFIVVFAVLYFLMRHRSRRRVL
jgi:FtsH-binding integral membrane protein